MTESNWLTVALAVVISVIAPLVLSIVTNRNQRNMKELDWARQDKVAADVAESTRQMLERTDKAAEQAKKAAALLVESNKTAAVNSLKVQGQLHEIHTLVNSNLTASIQAELDSTTRELAGLNEIISLTHAAGREPSPATVAAISAAEARLIELTATLADRKSRQVIVDETIKNTAAVIEQVKRS